MPEDLQSIACGKAIELEHDRRIKRRHVAMPDVVHDAGEKDIGVTAFERLGQRQLRNAVLLSKIFAQEQPVDSGRVASHDHVLIVVRKNLRLNEVTWAE